MDNPSPRSTFRPISDSLGILSVPGWIWAWLIVGVGFVIALTVPTVWLPSDELGLRRFQLEIDAAVTISQTFNMPADDFHAIELFPASMGERVSGDLRFDLYDVTGRVGLVHRADVPAADVLRTAAYRLEFPPIRGSADQRYRLDVLASPSRPAEGVALWATKGRRYSGGTMFFNDRERWADLAFTTFAPAGRSIWRRLMDASAAQPGLSLAHVVIGALAAYWMALGVVLRALWGFSSSATSARTSAGRQDECG